MIDQDCLEYTKFTEERTGLFGISMDCTCTYLFESPDSEVSPSDEVSPNREAIWLSLITPFVIMRRWKVVILLRDVYQYSISN